MPESDQNTPKSPKSGTKQINVSLPTDLWRRMKSSAEALNLPVAAYARQILQVALAHDPPSYEHAQNFHLVSEVKNAHEQIERLRETVAELRELSRYCVDCYGILPDHYADCPSRGK